MGVTVEIYAEGSREFVKRCALPRRRALPDNSRDLFFLATQILEPRIDQLELHRRKAEGVHPDVKLVRAVRTDLAIVRVSVQQRDAGINGVLLFPR